MEISVQPGRYVVAVSGGVDSMALLHMLKSRPGLELTVAHFDHGIRPDSSEDAALVRRTAEVYGLPFVMEAGNLGASASEAAARKARYAFLERVRTERHARAIITAHHQDDVLETAILNLLRGTGRKGLTSLASTDHIVRPLLHISKQTVIAYAQANGLKWHEDSTNASERYLRNYIRLRLVPQLTPHARQQLLETIERARLTNQQLDEELMNLLQLQPHAEQLDRRAFAGLPHSVAKELLASWLRAHGIANFDAKMLERVTIAAKVQPPGAIIDVVGGTFLNVTPEVLALARRER